MIAIRKTLRKGRGVFADLAIATGTLIEEGPVVVVPAEEVTHLDRTTLANYYFCWGADEAEAALLCGLCALCNHSYDPNAVFVLNHDRLTISFFARRNIAPGDEVTINYNGDPESDAPIVFQRPD